MIYVLIACLVLAVGICLMLLVLWRQERRGRRASDRRLSRANGRTADAYRDPFPFGKRLP